MFPVGASAGGVGVGRQRLSQAGGEVGGSRPAVLWSIGEDCQLPGWGVPGPGGAQGRALVDKRLYLPEEWTRELDDKSENPRFGYRAVHLDISYQGRLMEIQVQTRNQFRWQQTAERAAGYDVSIKYGGGHPAVAQALRDLSEMAWRCDLAGTDFPESDESLADFVILLAQTMPDILTPHSD